MSCTRDPRTPMGRWRASVSVSDVVTAVPAVPRRHSLVFLDRPTDARCQLCGFPFECPGEAARFLGGLAHTSCADDPSASMRGGA
jgi:hypothetical protein